MARGDVAGRERAVNAAAKRAPRTTIRWPRCVGWAVVALVSLAVAAPATADAIDDVKIDVSSRVSLARLVDLSSQQTAVAVDYNPAELERITVAIRLPSGVAPRELWELTNQLLAQNGFTTVRPPGATTMSVVKIADAAGLARLEEAVPREEALRPGFESRLVELRHRPGKDVVDAVRLVLSRPGGSVTAIADGRQIVIADLGPRIEQAIWLVDRLDVEGPSPVVERITTRALPASQLATMVTMAIEAQRPFAPTPIRGSVRVAPTGDDATLLLVAPPDEIPALMALIARFDDRAEVVTTAYVVRGVELAQVSTLIEQTARDTGPRGAGVQWRIVTDSLTGTLVITATSAEHARIEGTLARLDEIPAESRIPVRTYPIRNRSVEEMLQLLQDLVASGIMVADMQFEPSAPFDATPASQRVVLEPAIRADGGVPSSRTGEAQRMPPPADPPRGAGRVPTGGAAPLRITADKATNTLIAAGDPPLLAQLESLLATLDVRQPQVMLEVLVLSVNDSDSVELGVEIEKLVTSGDTLLRLASLFALAPPPLVPIAGAIAAPPIADGQGGTAIVLRPGDYGVLVRALQTLNEGRGLNIPRVLVNNNEQGSLDSTLQIPFLSTNASTTVATTSFGGSDAAGTTVTIRPQIAAGDHMRLEYAVALSSFVGAAANPALPPPKQQNNLRSIVTIPDGHTVVVGGLEIITDGEAITQVPLLGDIPGLGELFKRRTRTASRTRFFVFITPQVLRRDGFEDLRHISERQRVEAGLTDGLPVVEPQVID